MHTPVLSPTSNKPALLLFYNIHPFLNWPMTHQISFLSERSTTQMHQNSTRPSRLQMGPSDNLLAILKAWTYGALTDIQLDSHYTIQTVNILVKTMAYSLSILHTRSVWAFFTTGFISGWIVVFTCLRSMSGSMASTLPFVESVSSGMTFGTKRAISSSHLMQCAWIAGSNFEMDA